MPKLTPEGEKVIAALAERYAMGVDSVKLMLDAVAKGDGSMAQFNLPEFGGSGQWMRGGMTMVGDMFNNSLKATVDNLCSELSNILAGQPGIEPVTILRAKWPLTRAAVWKIANVIGAGYSARKLLAETLPVRRSSSMSKETF